MGYNAQLLKTAPIPSRKGSAGETIPYAIIPAIDQRVTIPSLRLRVGTTAGKLFVFQTEAIYRISLRAETDMITIPGIPTGLIGRYVVIRHPSGAVTQQFVINQTGTTLSLADYIDPVENGTLYILGGEKSPSTTMVPLPASTKTVLSGECPGVFVGRELGWPLMLYLENSSDEEEIEGGTVAFIGV